jgi:serine phosphatase RsbU (regulator of sigma subunit)
MELKHYLKGKNRKEFATKIGTKVTYLNNLCQRPEQAGKNIIKKIIAETDGAISFEDMTVTVTKTKSQGTQKPHKG